MCAARSNWDLLIKINFNREDFEKNLTLDPSFEFNKLECLDIILENNQAWPKLMEFGATYPLTPISEEERMDRLRSNVARGNYLVRDKTTAEKISEFVEEETKIDFLLSIHKDMVVDILGEEYFPIYIVAREMVIRCLFYLHQNSSAREISRNFFTHGGFRNNCNAREIKCNTRHLLSGFHLLRFIKRIFLHHCSKLPLPSLR